MNIKKISTAEVHGGTRLSAEYDDGRVREITFFHSDGQFNPADVAAGLRYFAHNLAVAPIKASADNA